MISLATGAVVFLLAAPGAAAPRPVELTFKWPPRLRCEVAHQLSMSRDGQPQSSSSTEHLLIEARRNRRGWEIRRTLVRQERPEPPPSAASVIGSRRPDSKERMALKALQFPSFLVRADGTFAGLALTAAERTLIAKQDETRREAEAEAAKHGVTLPSEPMEKHLEDRARSEWEGLVAAWNGGAPVPGVPSTSRTETDTEGPFGGPIHVVRNDTAILEAGVPCSPAPPGGCVRIEVTGKPDMRGSPPPANTPPGSAAPMAAIAAGKVQTTAVTTLITDPRTLIPRSFNRVMTTNFPSGAPGAKPGGTTRVEETSTFSCKP